MKIRKKIHDNWETPNKFLDKIREEFGEFYDPCPLNADFNGLKTEWGKVNFINPPYNRKDKEAFIEKAYKVAHEREPKVCVMLLPVSTSTDIFHNYIWDEENNKCYDGVEIRFINKRIKFKGFNSKGELVNDKCGMHDSMLVIFKGKEVLNGNNKES